MSQPMRKAFALVLGVAVLVCMLVHESPAQCRIVDKYPPEPPYICTSVAYPHHPIGAVCPVFFGTGMDCGPPGGCMCAPYKAKPQQPRCQTCSQRSGTPPQGGHPIDLATGNTFIRQTDISLPGLGGGLSLTRTWNSIPSSVYASGSHMFGLGWQSNYEDRLVYQTSDGFLTEKSGAEDETAYVLNSPAPA